jgi:hypothetical protein
MTRAQHSEVPVVESRELGLVQSLDDGQDGGVDKSHVRVRITVANFADADVVGTGDVFHPVSAGQHVVKEGDHHTGVQLCVDQVIQLWQHWRRDDQLFLGLVQQGAAGLVAGVAAVQDGIEGSCVKNQRHERGGVRSVAAVRAVSFLPDSAIPILLGRGR